MNKVTIQSRHHDQFRNSIQKLVALVILLTSTVFHLSAQTAIGGNTPDPSAMLDVQSQSRGMLFPRMTTQQRDAIVPAATGLMIFNTTTVCLEINLGSSGNPAWQGIKCLGSISNLNCGGAILTGSLLPDQPATGVSVSVPYLGGNGGVFEAKTTTSTDVTGLTATLSAGSFASGSGNLSYTITGTPSSSGTASFALNIGGQSCDLELTVEDPGTITALDCTGAIRKGEMQPGINYESPSGVTVIIPYTGGNGQAYSGRTVMSTGNSTGFTATLSAGTFATGSGNLTYEITGSGEAGTATFALNIGGKTCTLDLEVKSCTANIAPSTPKTFLCYNLGAYNTRASSAAPSWEVNGGYWRWGIKAEVAAGPTSSDASGANSGPISSWSTLPTGANDAWLEGQRGEEDPCPTGFRVPSKAEWLGVRDNNTESNVGGTWSSSATNYTTGKNFGSLFLPAAGERDGYDADNGVLIGRGSNGYYWSSYQFSTNAGGALVFESGPGAVATFDATRRSGFSVRCIIAE